MIEKLLSHLLISIIRVLSGVFIGSSIATGLAIFIPVKSKIGFIVNRIVYSLHPIPKIIFFPFFLSFFGLGEMSKVIMISVYGFFQTFIVMRDSIQHIDTELLLYMQTMKAKNWDIIIHTIWPNSLPYLFTCLRNSFGVSFAVLFLVESFASITGIGYYIIDTWSRGADTELLLSIISIGCVGLTLTGLTRYLENLIVVWNRPTRHFFKRKIRTGRMTNGINKKN